MIDVRRYPDLGSAGRALAELIVAHAGREVKQKGFFTLVLSGGNTPRALHACLAARPISSRMPWKRTFVFWGDERFVPHDHPDSNAALARETLFDKVDIPMDQVFAIPTDCASPLEAAERYEKTIRAFFDQQGHVDGDVPRFDCLLLGMGADGHTASLFPNSELLGESRRLVAAVLKPAGSPAVPRVTLTLPVINRARLAAFLVNGAGKNKILEQILHDPEKAATMYPAAMVQPEDRLLWFTAP